MQSACSALNPTPRLAAAVKPRQGWPRDPGMLRPDLPVLQVQTPEVQTALVGHFFAHAPQLAASMRRFLQTPAQSVSPVLQTMEAAGAAMPTSTSAASRACRRDIFEPFKRIIRDGQYARECHGDALACKRARLLPPQAGLRKDCLEGGGSGKRARGQTTQTVQGRRYGHPSSPCAAPYPHL